MNLKRTYVLGSGDSFTVGIWVTLAAKPAGFFRICPNGPGLGLVFEILIKWEGGVGSTTFVNFSTELEVVGYHTGFLAWNISPGTYSRSSPNWNT
jgi:hypothetical protein